MKTVVLKFRADGWSAAVGTFAMGDLLRCSPELAKHLVDDAHCADYLDLPADAPTDATAEDLSVGVVQKPRKRASKPAPGPAVEASQLPLPDAEAAPAEPGVVHEPTSAG